MSENPKLSDNVIATYVPGQEYKHYCCMTFLPGLRIVRDFRAGTPTCMPELKPDKLQVPWACRECGRIEWKDVQIVSYEEAEPNKERGAMNCDEPTALANSGLSGRKKHLCPSCACEPHCSFYCVTACENYVEQTTCDKCVGCETGDPDNGGCEKFIPKQKEDTMANEIVNPQITDAVTGKHADSSEGIITGSVYDAHMEILSGRDWHGDPAAPCYKKENFKGETPEKLLTFSEACKEVFDRHDLEWREKGTKQWWPYTSDDFLDTRKYDYRRKPTKKIVPWTYETPLLGLHVKAKDGSCRGVITYQASDRVLVGAYGGTESYQQLLNNYVQLDGRPCGAEAEEA